MEDARRNRDAAAPRQWLAAVLLPGLYAATAVAGDTAPPTFRFGFAPPMDGLSGAPGEKIFAEVLATLTTADNTTSDGVQGWSMSIGIEGGTIDAIELDELTVSTIYFEDHDDDPETPPIRRDPYEQDLGADEPPTYFSVAEVGFHTLDPDRPGAVTAVALRLNELMMLQPTGTVAVARLRIAVPVGESGASVRLFYEDGFRSPRSMWVSNWVTFQGASFRPVLGSITVPLEVRPPHPFRLGDVNADGSQDLSDAVFLLNFLFRGGPEPSCRRTMDLNGDANADLSDPIFLLRFLFLHEATPREPYRECGLDAVSSALSCASYPPCEA